jgi:hypothetical protein
MELICKHGSKRSDSEDEEQTTSRRRFSQVDSSLLRDEHSAEGHPANSNRGGSHFRARDSANGKSAGSISKNIHKTKPALPPAPRKEKAGKHESSGNPSHIVEETTGSGKDNHKARHVIH